VNYILALAIVVSLGGPGSAVAGDHERNDDSTAQERAISVHELKTKAAESGYDVSRLEKALAITKDVLEPQGWRIALSASNQLRGLKVKFEKAEE
jgi:hypothetical protein